MGLRINTNVQSLSAQRHLGNSHQAQQNSLEKLASGTRINRAADDAAGLAIATKMGADIRSLDQAHRNAEDGISLIQTAEGGMNETANILIRMRELSIQAASDTIGNTEREFVDREVQALKSEVDRIAAAVEYNGTRLLDGTGEQIDVQIGLNNDPDQDRFAYDAGQINTTNDALGIADINTLEKSSAQENLTVLDEAIKNVASHRATVGAMQNRLQSTIQNIDVYNENLAAGKSRIFDVDMAKETAVLTKENIMTQAGVNVLSQANQNNRMALNLL